MSINLRWIAICTALIAGFITAWLPGAVGDNRHLGPASIQLARADAPGAISIISLPPEARETLRLVKQGGPFPYPKDGTTFGNREKRLPLKPRGYYKEYTVRTHGARDRGARRIIAGSGGEFYYTDDHYNTFKLIVE